MTPIALTIAGSDSSGGAGVQADLKTFSALGVYGASVITAVTAQNTRAVRAIHAVPAGVVQAQIEAVLSDLAVGAIKIGMLWQRDIVEIVATELTRWQQIRVVLDPVMVASSGAHLLAALTGQHGVQLRSFPESLIRAARQQAGAVVGELAAKSAAARRIHDSYVSFRDRSAAWSRISIKAVLEARDG